MLERLRQIADGAGKIAGVESKFTVQSGCYEILVNMAGAKLLQQNLMMLGPIKYTDQEKKVEKAIEQAGCSEQKGLDGEVKPTPKHRSPIHQEARPMSAM